MTQLNPIHSDLLEDNRVTHGFFTREGGVSTGIYEGLNTGLGSNDDKQNVMQNRTLIARHMSAPIENLVTPYQIHSSDVATIDTPWKQGENPQLDAVVTATPGIAIGVQSADCGPVLFCDAETRIIGAAHAGWKGATGGILENTISAMEDLGSTRANIKAVLGPTISVKNYEVGPEFVERLINLHAQNEKFLSPSPQPEHAMFDLPGYIIDRLTAANVTAAWTGHCTYEDEKRFYSYRRKTHKNEADYGRQIAVIAIQS